MLMSSTLRGRKGTSKPWSLRRFMISVGGAEVATMGATLRARVGSSGKVRTFGLTPRYSTTFWWTFPPSRTPSTRHQ